MMLQLVAHLLLCLMASLDVCSAQETLSVAIITRHGRRNPINSYPGDPYADVFKKNGYADLNPDGKLQMYTVGKDLAQRFPELLRRNVTVLKSSRSDRTIESIRLIMKGLSGPSSTLDDDDNYDVITVPNKEDALLNHDALDCPKRKESIDNDVTLKLLYRSTSSLWDSIAELIGVKGHSPNFSTFYALENLYTEYVIGMKLPEWATWDWFGQIKRQLDLVFWFTSQIKIEGKLSGVFFGDLINNFKNALASKNVSFFAYGTHDWSLSPILVTLDLWPGQRPETGESLIFVLKTNGDLQVYYYTKHHKMHQKILPGCDKDNCTLERFEKAVKHLIPDDWRIECGVNASVGDSTR